MEILINHLAEKPIHHLAYWVCIIWTAVNDSYKWYSSKIQYAYSFQAIAWQY